MDDLSFPMFSACRSLRDVSQQAADLARRVVAAGGLSADDDMTLWASQATPWHSVFEVQFEEAMAQEVTDTWQSQHGAFSPLLRVFLEAVSRLKPMRFAEACQALEKRMAKDPADRPTFREMLRHWAPYVRTVSAAHLKAMEHRWLIVTE